MKKSLLFAAALVSSVAFSQVINNFTTGTFTGFQFNKIYASGLLTGTLTSVGVSGTLSASTNETYADDLCIYVSPTNALAAAGPVQAGGFSTITGVTQKLLWANGGSDPVGTVVNDTKTLTTPVVFTGNTSYSVWLGNGYNGTGTSGTWTNITTTLTGLSLVTQGVSDVVVSKNVTVYPNPTIDFVKISNTGSYKINAVSISDMSGKSIRTLIPSNPSETFTVDVKDLAKGVYMMIINTSEGQTVKKIIKN